MSVSILVSVFCSVSIRDEYQLNLTIHQLGMFFSTDFCGGLATTRAWGPGKTAQNKTACFSETQLMNEPFSSIFQLEKMLQTIQNFNLMNFCCLSTIFIHQNWQYQDFLSNFRLLSQQINRKLNLNIFPLIVQIGQSIFAGYFFSRVILQADILRRASKFEIFNWVFACHRSLFIIVLLASFSTSRDIYHQDEFSEYQNCLKTPRYRHSKPTLLLN